MHTSVKAILKVCVCHVIGNISSACVIGFTELREVTPYCSNVPQCLWGFCMLEGIGDVCFGAWPLGAATY
jgi:hypothetical protein